MSKKTLFITREARKEKKAGKIEKLSRYKCKIVDINANIPTVI